MAQRTQLIGGNCPITDRSADPLHSPLADGSADHVEGHDPWPADFAGTPETRALRYPTRVIGRGSGINW
jgi:hypothetical protein